MADQDPTDVDGHAAAGARQHAGRARLHRQRAAIRSFATTGSGRCTRCRQELLQAGTALRRLAAVPGGKRLLRRRRRRCAGRETRREPAQPYGRELRGSHAGRPVVSHPAPQGGRRRRRHGDDGHHRAKAGRTGSRRTRKAQLHVALDNMPGALVYTDGDLRIRRLQQPIQGDVHRPAGAAAARRALSRFPALPRSQTATTAKATSMRWSRSAWRACATPRARASRTTRPMAAGIAFCDGAWRAAARSR